MGTRLPIKLLWALGIVLGILVLTLLIILTVFQISDVLASRSSQEDATSVQQKKEAPEAKAPPDTEAPEEATGTFSGEPALAGQKILFGRSADDSRGGGLKNLFSIDLGSGEVTRVARGDTDYSDIDASLDGKVVYSAGSELYLMNSDGTGRRVIFGRGSREPGEPQISFIREPVFSPDGTKVAFVSTEGEGQPARIYVVNVDGTGLRRATDSSKDGHLSPGWTADGSGVVYLKEKDALAATDEASPASSKSYVERLDGLYVTDLESTEEKRLTDGAEVGSETVSYSPAAERVAFGRLEGNYSEIFVMNTDGTDRKKITNDDSNQFLVSLSPDGERLLFASRDGLYLANADGTNPRKLLDEPPEGLPGSIAWSR